MRILIAHNYYRSLGGEDRSFTMEARMLRDRGHKVIQYVEDNRSLCGRAPISAGLKAIWNHETYRSVRRLIRQSAVSVCALHNTFPLISPSVYYAAKAERVPVVQKIANYRLICPAATLFREGRICTECVGSSVPWPAVAHGCYRGSRLASACTAAMVSAHRVLGTWTECVDAFVTPSEFTKRQLIGAGLPANKVHVNPNFVDPDPGQGEGKGGFALYAGRLSQEKGLRTLVRAWNDIGRRLPLKIAGGGPLESFIESVSARTPSIEWLGHLAPEQVMRLMQEASVVIVPSEWYEVFGLVIIEAYAAGVPVIGSNIGAIASIIDPGRTGLLFRPGDHNDLCAQVDWMLSHPQHWQQMRQQARHEFESKYTAEESYRFVMGLYSRLIDARRTQPFT